MCFAFRVHGYPRGRLPAIGPTEMLRGGQRAEIIVDPATGLVIGERQLSTMAVFGFGVDEVLSLTAIETSVAPTAP